MSRAVDTEQDQILDALAVGTSDNPFAVLGRHGTTLNGRPAVVIRTMQPAAASVELVTPRGAVPMQRRRREGLFEATVALEGTAEQEFAYHFRIQDCGGVREVHDA